MLPILFLFLTTVHVPTIELAERFAVGYDTAREIYAGAECAEAPPMLAFAMARQESGFRHDAIGAAGEIGMLQLMPSTARIYGIEPDQLYDVVINVCTGMEYLMDLYDHYDDIHMALAAYNMGPTRFAELGYRKNSYPYQVLGE